MLSLIFEIRDILRGRKFAKTVQPYMFGPPDDLQATISYRIWRKSLGEDDDGAWKLSLDEMIGLRNQGNHGLHI